jgi:hypothetical protein
MGLFTVQISTHTDRVLKYNDNSIEDRVLSVKLSLRTNIYYDKSSISFK